MKLKSVRVQNYRSVEDSGEFTIGDITRLVGMNESGKTAVLNAIHGINPFDKEGGYDKDKDYPKQYGAYDHTEDNPTVVCTSVWEVSDREAATLAKEFGSDFLNLTCVVLRNNYDDELAWSFSANKKTVFNDKNILDHICRQVGLSPAERNVFAACKNIKDAYVAIKQIAESAGDISDRVVALLKRIDEYSDHDARHAVGEMLENMLPSFVYFSHYSRMSGELSVEQYKHDVQRDEVEEGDWAFNNFLNFAGASLEEIEKIGKHDVFATKLQIASNKISDQMFEYWKQNTDLEVRVKVDAGLPNDPEPYDRGSVIRASIYNKTQRVEVPFSERSSGFIWFFSFLASLSQAKETYAEDGRNLIILLDEPGLTLHAQAQLNLLRYMEEKLEPNFQVIYTTHSPFMIFPQRWDTIRTVEDMTGKQPDDRQGARGTKVSDNCLRTDSNTIFPLQGALGYSLSQTLFTGKKVLLVEGVSDFAYLKTASAILHECEKAHLEEWMICPVGGIDKISVFANLFFSGSEKDQVASLIDYQDNHKHKINKLKADHPEMRVFLYSKFCGKQEADVEDLFGVSMYLEILKQSYGTEIDPASIVAKNRIVKEVKSKVSGFTHGKPATWLMHNRELLVSGSDVAHTDAAEVLGRFEKVFKKLNFNPNLKKKTVRKKNENH